MYKTTKALVLREVRYKEADRIITVLTPQDGRMTVKARGALRKNSVTAAATQHLCWSEMTLFGSRGRWTVNEASTLEEFSGLRADISALALGSYFAECLEAFSAEDVPDENMLQLGLNSLYALSRGLYEQKLIKSFFELRLMCLTGYEPDLTGCAVCGRENPEKPVFSADDGALCCHGCRASMGGAGVSVTPAALSAMRYICCAPAKKLFAFPVEGEDLNALYAAAESYILLKSERRFGALDYWKKVR